MSNKSPGKGGSRLDAHLLRRIVGYLMPYKGWVVLAFITVMTAAYLGPLVPKLVQVTIDREIVEGDVSGLRRMVGILFAIVAAEGLLAFVNAYMTQWIGQQAIFDLRTKVYRHVQRQSLRFLTPGRLDSSSRGLQAMSNPSRRCFRPAL